LSVGIWKIQKSVCASPKATTFGVFLLRLLHRSLKIQKEGLCIKNTENALSPAIVIVKFNRASFQFLKQVKDKSIKVL
jgi:hypothetical protein